MAGFKNEIHQSRLVVIPKLSNAFAEIFVVGMPNGGAATILEGATPAIEIYQVNEQEIRLEEQEIFNFPFIFLSDGRPWNEANSYLLSVVKKKNLNQRPTDDVRRRASRLLEYMFFCERNSIDWLDFSGRRPSHRPTFRYYNYLIGRMSNAVLNQHTGVIYDFYTHVSSQFGKVDIARVDTVKEITIMLQTGVGVKPVTVQQRSQTKPSPPQSRVAIGFVRDEGEDLRPLSNKQLKELLVVIEQRGWSVQERLILLFALMTGARKQSVLTFRLKHLAAFSENRIQKDGTYLLHAGPGTGIDTKSGKPQTLRVPKQLAHDLVVYAGSKVASNRRRLFKQKIELSLGGGLTWDESDSYLFLSDQGNCYYMAKDDPRYHSIKSPPMGQVTKTLTNKISRFISNGFPKGFTYHWLRATFAFQLYQHLLPLIKQGLLQPGEEISIIQNRLHHSDRETTENYLKLFSMHSETLMAQEAWEGVLFAFQNYADLILGDE